MTATTDLPPRRSNHEIREEIWNRWGALKTERESWFTHWQDITDHILPRNGRYFVEDRNDSSASDYNEIIDETGTQALRILGAGMMAGATSPARPWFKLEPSNPDLRGFLPIRLWLDDVERRMMRVFQRSNTYRTLHGMYEELGAFGTAVSIVLPDFDTLIHHYPVTAGEYAVATNWKQKVETLYRRFRKTVGETVKEFGLDNVSIQVQRLYRDGELEQGVNILHAIEPRADRDPSKLDSRNMRWRSIYLEEGAEDDKILRESGFNQFPALVARWAVNGCDVYGHSPGMQALGSIKQLQQMQLRKSQAIDYQTKPPLQVPTNLKEQDNRIRPGAKNWYDPGGIAFVNQATPNSGIRSQFDVNLRLDWLTQDMEDVRARIRASFFSDMFLMLATAPVTSRMTATEVAERHEEKLLMLGPVIERLHNELLEPLIDITFQRMVEVDAIPPPPPDLEGEDLTVEFVSVLAQAQRAIGANATDRFVGNLTAVSQFKQDVLDKFNADKWADEYAEMLGVSPQLLVSDERVRELREARNRALAAQQQAEMLGQQAKTAKDLAGASTEGANLLSDLTQAGG